VGAAAGWAVVVVAVALAVTSTMKFGALARPLAKVSAGGDVQAKSVLGFLAVICWALVAWSFWALVR